MTAISLALLAAAGGGESGSSDPAAVNVALFATVVGSIILFGGAAVLALAWAFRDGQFDNFQQGSRSIFGPDEPIGEPTDAFPGMDPAEVAAPQDAIDHVLLDLDRTFQEALGAETNLPPEPAPARRRNAKPGA